MPITLLTIRCSFKEGKMIKETGRVVINNPIEETG